MVCAGIPVVGDAGLTSVFAFQRQFQDTGETYDIQLDTKCQCTAETKLRTLLSLFVETRRF